MRSDWNIGIFKLIKIFRILQLALRKHTFRSVAEPMHKNPELSRPMKMDYYFVNRISLGGNSFWCSFSPLTSAVSFR